jgi:hypothetical protein
VVMQASQGQGLDPSSDTDQSKVNYYFLSDSCESDTVRQTLPTKCVVCIFGTTLDSFSLNSSTSDKKKAKVETVCTASKR